MLDAQLSGSILKKGLDIPFAVGKAVGKLKAIVCLDTFHTESPACVPLHQTLEEVRGGIGGLLGIGGQKAEPGKLVNSGVLEKTQLRVCDTATRDDLHPPGFAGRDRSFAHRALEYRPFSSSLLETYPACASRGTGSQAGGYTPVASDGTTVLSGPGQDCGGAYPGSASTPLLCAGWDGCEDAGTGRPGIRLCHPSESARSRYTTGFGCTSGWHG